MGDCLAALGQLPAAIAAHQHALDIISKAVNKSLQGQVSVKLGVCLRALALQGRAASSSPEADDNQSGERAKGASQESPESEESKQESARNLAQAVAAFQKSQELFLATGQQEQYCAASLQVRV